MPINQNAARTVVEAAQAHAREHGLRVTVAVTDEGGLLKALDRIAEAKAQGAAVWHRDGHVLGEVNESRPAFVAAVSQMTRLPLIAGAGSLVIRDGAGEVLGAVGVSGGTPDEDRACAQAGLDARGM
jgi:uncharacterized protein GlcG (DUF336 family)